MRADLQKKKAKEFADYWRGKGYEKGESQKFWIDLLQSVYGVENATHYINFEDQVKLDHTSFIDGYIPETKVMIEQKSIDKSLTAPIKQSNGTFKTPFEQAKAYTIEMPYSKRPRWIVTCNFKEFHIYDMENPQSEPESILLENLPEEYFRMDFLVKENAEMLRKELELSIKAGEIVGNLYDALYKKYQNPESKNSQHSLNVLCVRLVFCMYAEDAGLFGRHNMFHDYLYQYKNNLRDFRRGLIEVFKILNTKYEERDPYEEELNQFPYVNGGLFDDKDKVIEVPQFDEDIINLILSEASEGFDWSNISPTIFGAVFESTLNPETRRKGGMHFTSIEDIHKVIDPLFLDELKEELNEIKKLKQYKTIEKRAREFQSKLASLKFLDPAAGSGNFLTESYISLRKFENEAIILQNKYQDQSQMMFKEKEYNPIKVSIQQFYGIEINDFAVTVAKTALWIAESQMMKKTEDIIQMDLDFLPLKSYSNIVQGNALKMNWREIIEKKHLNYIMGNPPFSGGMYMTPEQKNEIRHLFYDVKGAGELDYVCGWYKKAAEYIKNEQIRCAFVSTNSICQGEQVLTFWKHLIHTYNIQIDFAYKTFEWDNGTANQAKVHCIIIGFSEMNEKNVFRKKLFDGDGEYEYCKNISPYLTNTDNNFIESRSKPICNVSPMKFGSMPRDGGGFILTSEERKDFIKTEPLSEKWIKPYYGAVEFLNNKERYCLWLLDANHEEILKCPKVLERISKVRDFRLASKAEGTRKFAATPTIFCQIAQPNSDYLMVPKTSSGKRKYLPIGFQNKNIIASDLVFLIPNASLYEFGVLMSNIHNCWMRVVAGRLKSDYRYSKDIVYNNFIWPNEAYEQKKKIEETAQEILNARNKYPNIPLSKMYSEKMYLYPELVKAHEANDKAVMKAYGFKPSMTEDEIVAEMFKLYQEKVKEL